MCRRFPSVPCLLTAARRARLARDRRGRRATSDAADAALRRTAVADRSERGKKETDNLG